MPIVVVGGRVEHFAGLVGDIGRVGGVSFAASECRGVRPVASVAPGGIGFAGSPVYVHAPERAFAGGGCGGHFGSFLSDNPYLTD